MTVTKDAGFPVTSRNVVANAHDLTWPAFTTPGTNRMVLAMYLASGATANAISTFTSPNLTWTRHVNLVDAANNYRVEVWAAWAASAVTAEVISSVDTASANYDRRSMIIWSLDGSSSTGVGVSNGADVQTKTADTGDADITLTAAAAGSYIVAGYPYRASGADPTVDANTTSEYDALAGGGGGFAFNERAGSRTSAGAGSITLGWTGDDPFNLSVIAGVEVKASGGGGGGPTVTYPMLERGHRGSSRGVAVGVG